MKLKDDYCQSVPEVRLCTIPDDKHIEVWWNAISLYGEIYPVELQLSIRGEVELSENLNKEYCMLIGFKREP